jgi:hypothetical protein
LSKFLPLEILRFDGSAGVLVDRPLHVSLQRAGNYAANGYESLAISFVAFTLLTHRFHCTSGSMPLLPAAEPAILRSD